MCGSPDHLTNQCPQAKPLCWTCKGTGHRSAECANNKLNQATETAETSLEQAPDCCATGPDGNSDERNVFGLLEEGHALGEKWNASGSDDGTLGILGEDAGKSGTIHSLVAGQPCTDAQQEVLTSFIDSGASRSVCPARHGQQFGLKSTLASRSGNGFRTATNKRVVNLGERTIGGRNENGQMVDMTYAVANVASALDSVSQICDTGAEVLFTKAGGEIRRQNGTVIPFQRDGNNYVRKVWVTKAIPFTRQKTQSS